MESSIKCFFNRNVKQCQVLANLCVLHQGNLQNQVCKFFKDISSLEVQHKDK